MLTSYTETEVSHKAWIIDSWASHDVTHDRSLYVEFRVLDNTYVTFPNGHTVKIEEVGYIQLTDALSLYHVLFIPAFKFNLLSVSVITKTLNYEVSFTADSCVIQALSKELMIGQGSQVANLYVLNYNTTHDSFSLPGKSSFCSKVCIDSNT